MMEKIKSIKQNDDSTWITLNATEKSMECVSEIFGLKEEIIIHNEEDGNQVPFNNYDEWLKYSPNFVITKKEYLAYFILSDKTIHIILRKIGKWESYKQKITEKFEFAKR